MQIPPGSVPDDGLAGLEQMLEAFAGERAKQRSAPFREPAALDLVVRDKLVRALRAVA